MLDRHDILAALKSLFEADTTVLYGKGLLLNHISINLKEFEKAAVNIYEPYKMYMIASEKNKIATGMNKNTDVEFIIEYRIEGLARDPEEAYQNIDDIDERIEHLVDNEMWGGTKLTGHFSDSESSVIDMEHISSNLDIDVDDNNQLNVYCDGSIRVLIDRVAT